VVFSWCSETDPPASQPQQTKVRRVVPHTLACFDGCLLAARRVQEGLPSEPLEHGDSPLSVWIPFPIPPRYRRQEGRSPYFFSGPIATHLRSAHNCSLLPSRTVPLIPSLSLLPPFPLPSLPSLLPYSSHIFLEVLQSTAAFNSRWLTLRPQFTNQLSLAHSHKSNDHASA